MQERYSDVAGVVLAGGLSSRLGQDKWALRLHGDGKPHILGRTLDLLAGLVPQAWVSCRKEQAFTEYNCLYDDANGLGPVSGIMAGVMAAEHGGYAAVLALSCDMPFMSAALLDRLLAARQERASHTLVTTFCHEQSGHVQPLVAIYEVAALPYFELAMTMGQRQVRRIIPPDRQKRVSYGGAEEQCFFNINTAADLAEARRLLIQHSGTD